MDLFPKKSRDRRVVRPHQARRFGAFGGVSPTIAIAGDLAGTSSIPLVQLSHFKGNPVFDVQAYGAVGDGVHDDTTAIQSAFNALPASGGTVHFPQGVYKVSASITYTGNNFRVRGPAKIVQVTTGTQTFQFTSCSNFSIENLFLYGYGADFNPAADTLGDGFYLASCNRFTIEKCQFQNHGHSAIRAHVCTMFRLIANSIEGTFDYGTTINAGDNYQFGLLIQWDGTNGSTDFELTNNNIQKTAQGIRVEPFARRFVISGNSINSIKGQHGMYINGQNFTISGNAVYNNPTTIGIGIKLQSFWSPTPTTDAIISASVTGNSVDTCLSGINVEHLTGAPQSSAVSIVGNTVKNASSGGNGIYAADVDNLKISGNSVHGGSYGIFVGKVDTGSIGSIDGNTISDTQWCGIYAYTYQSVTIRGNRILRPCLAAVASDPQQDAIYGQGASAGNRIEVSGNNLLVDTSTGVVHGLLLFTCTAWVGDNDWNDVGVSFNTVTLRKQTWCSDLTGTQAWTPGAISSGAKAITTFAVTNAALGDFVVVSYNQDLQGCSLSGYVSSSGNLSVTISNSTGGSITPAAGTIRYLVMHRIN